jgi:hypothetical protein
MPEASIKDAKGGDMAFYEVHDEHGCLRKTRERDVAKRTALALLTMKAGRQVRIQVHADNSPGPRRTILVDSIAALRPRPMSVAVAPAE